MQLATIETAAECGEMTAILNRQTARESSARTYARSFPIVPVSATGIHVTGADGKRYFDCLSGAGTLALGHNHPAVIDALHRALDSTAPLHILDLATPEKDDFTTALFETLPAEFAADARIHFCGPSGADAIEAALKLARTATGKRTVLSFTGGYHGMTGGAQAITGNVGLSARVGGIISDVVRLPYPYEYRCPFGRGGEDTAQISAEYVEHLLDDPSGGVSSPAAMVLEVVQGEGGVVPASSEWLRSMRRITQERGIPLIVDEVQTGVGRTGAIWAIEHSGIIPDMIAMSKAIGGSLPLAALTYRSEYDCWTPGAHTGTFRGNTLAMVAGAVTLRTVQDDRLQVRAAELGATTMRRFQDLSEELPCIGDVRGRGLMMGLELVDPTAEPDATGARPPAPELAATVRSECLNRGVIVELGGRHDSVLRLLPPLIATDGEMNEVIDRVIEALAVAQRDHTGGTV
ncbi:diaminobutyrate--2-oxoglutarate transaminase family protein [Tsukamurella ocularis]|uniref:diaminobutyrate--2-oxoglutarate transaminase family protein n=1 Tax=Tsukamurella ocularis TaxID=1970234 RepID=UPI0021687EEB|nr:diaminobutyrate--2-oxoglutarate transaminase family protein [Tsukamurella ocularis]MCS3780421.1 diaminobutyrate-2-oxoglutarate transaminase [Tsukamurella ocularis]MCS3786024.1 diaminobutyrate-2-oxoglutarate transaminase [Tsukamurella ocularis]MCS3849388.1 diaminobutyrate-2-oxoglutarate transaminase [Tsukamurella ocularis]